MSIRIGKEVFYFNYFLFGRSTYQVLVRADYVYEFILALRSKKNLRLTRLLCFSTSFPFVEYDKFLLSSLNNVKQYSNDKY